MVSNKVYVIGIGYKPLDKKAEEIILKSSVILASNRIFEVFQRYDEFEAVKNKIKVINNVDETIEFIRTKIQMHENAEFPIVLLASGDPMFFGIGRRAIREFGKECIEIIPDLSSIQLAFSRIKESWEDAFLMSLHGGPDPAKRRNLPYTINDIPSIVQRYNKVAILTDKENSPSEIAKILNLSPIVRNLLPLMYVCERLGYADEKITEGSSEQIAGMRFSEPNVVIVKSEVRSQESEVRFGLSETEITHSKGLITKDEVRAVTIHKLRLPDRGVFWDIGAGSGSVSIEVARLFPELKIFAIEKDQEQIEYMLKNKNQFNATNIEVIKGEAPDALKDIPSPDRVFIGGSGDRLREIMDYIIKKHVSHIVINATTIDTVANTIQCFEEHGYNVAISEISISRAKTINDKKHLSALNPIFVITGEK